MILMKEGAVINMVKEVPTLHSAEHDVWLWWGGWSAWGEHIAAVIHELCLPMRKKDSVGQVVQSIFKKRERETNSTFNSS